MTPNNPTDEQIEFFWRWCGFTKSKDVPGYQPGWWVRPDKRVWGKNPPFLDLNNIFKYAVPKLDELKYVFQLYRFYTEAYEWKTEKHPVEHGFGVKLHKYGWSKETEAVIDANPALALFWAIWQVIEKDVTA